MKQFIYSICLVFFIASCNKGKQTLDKVQELSNSAQRVSGTIQESQKISSEVQELAKTTPIPKETFTSWLAIKVGGFTRISYSAGGMSAAGISSINATYTSKDASQKIEIKLIDGAGPSGSSALAGMQMVLAGDYEEESQTSSKKTITNGKYRALQEYNKQDRKTGLQLVYNRRLLLVVKATNLSPHKVWEFVEALDLEKLNT